MWWTVLRQGVMVSWVSSIPINTFSTLPPLYLKSVNTAEALFSVPLAMWILQRFDFQNNERGHLNFFVLQHLSRFINENRAVTPKKAGYLCFMTWSLYVSTSLLCVQMVVQSTVWLPSSKALVHGSLQAILEYLIYIINIFARAWVYQIYTLQESPRALGHLLGTQTV